MMLLGVEAADRPAGRPRSIILHKARIDSALGIFGRVKRFEKEASVVAVDVRFDHDYAVESGGKEFHVNPPAR
jgi:hypothetical protein